MIGNVLEWYDFAIYGNFATSIGHNFFRGAGNAGSSKSYASSVAYSTIENQVQLQSKFALNLANNF